MNTTDFLCDFLQALDEGETYNGFRVCHGGRSVDLDALGTAGYEHFASITNDMLWDGPVYWRFHRIYPKGRIVELLLLRGEEDVVMPGGVEVHGAAVEKTDELIVSGILGKVKGMYS